MCMVKHSFLGVLDLIKLGSSLSSGVDTGLECVSAGELLLYEIEVRGNYTSIFQTYFQCFIIIIIIIIIFTFDVRKRGREG